MNREEDGEDGEGQEEGEEVEGEEEEVEGVVEVERQQEFLDREEANPTLAQALTLTP